MSEDSTGVVAVRSMSELSNTIIMSLNADIKKIVQRQDHLEDLIRECNDLTRTLTKKVMELSHEVHEMRKLLRDPTLDALTGPLLQLQEKNHRRREASATVRRMKEEESGSGY